MREILADVVEPGAVRVVDLGDDRAIHFYADGTVRFAHVCDRDAGPTHARGVIRCAPRLQMGQGHRVVTAEPLTIVASILCPDCRTHGWVRDGAWVGC